MHRASASTSTTPGWNRSQFDPRAGTGPLADTVPGLADEIRFDSAREWRNWPLSRNIVELSANGRLLPVTVRCVAPKIYGARSPSTWVRSAGPTGFAWSAASCPNQPIPAQPQSAASAPVSSRCAAAISTSTKSRPPLIHSHSTALLSGPQIPRSPLRSQSATGFRRPHLPFLPFHTHPLHRHSGRQSQPTARRPPSSTNSAIASDSDIVRLLVGEDLLAEPIFNSAIITPNNDGINEELRIAVDLVNVRARLCICASSNLAGLIVFEHPEYTRAGRQSLVWDSTDELEHRVVPGAYIADLSIEGDAQKEHIRRVA